MKQTIYIDVLFCVNFIIDYIILLSVKKFRNLRTKNSRLLLSAFVGGIGSFIILLPPMPVLLSWTVNIIEAVIITASAFLPMRFKAFLKTFSSLFLISFSYCGVMTAVLSLFSPKNLIIRNSTVYINISPVILILITLLCYISMRIILKLSCKKISRELNCDIEISHNGKILFLNGSVDTGNTLHEPFSGECVIVANADLFKDFFDAQKYISSNSTDIIKDGFRLVPFKSVGGNGLIPAFRPSKLYIIENNKKTEIHAYIGLCDNKYLSDDNDVLVPLELVL
ncbi:MAG: sigma-E processing peptidase SpoIIGA [Clostridia bacterium]|nr:sigma-E processing peptidase SpoIIGA [Clostridia bacterium]